MSEEQTKDFQTFGHLLKEYLSRQEEQARSELDQFSQEELYTKYQTYRLQLSSDSLMNPEAVFLDWLDSRKYRQLAQPEPDNSTKGPQPGAGTPEPEQQASSSPSEKKESPGDQHQQSNPDHSQEKGSDKQIPQNLTSSNQEHSAQREQAPTDIEANARQAIEELGLSTQQIDALVQQTTQELDLDIKGVIQGTPVPPKDQQPHTDQSENFGR